MMIAKDSVLNAKKSVGDTVNIATDSLSYTLGELSKTATSLGRSFSPGVKLPDTMAAAGTKRLVPPDPNGYSVDRLAAMLASDVVRDATNSMSDSFSAVTTSIRSANPLSNGVVFEPKSPTELFGEPLASTTTAGLGATALTVGLGVAANSKSGRRSLSKLSDEITTVLRRLDEGSSAAADIDAAKVLLEEEGQLQAENARLRAALEQQLLAENVRLRAALGRQPVVARRPRSQPGAATADLRTRQDKLHEELMSTPVSPQPVVPPTTTPLQAPPEALRGRLAQMQTLASENAGLERMAKAVSQAVGEAAPKRQATGASSPYLEEVRQTHEAAERQLALVTADMPMLGNVRQAHEKTRGPPS